MKTPMMIETDPANKAAVAGRENPNKGSKILGIGNGKILGVLSSQRKKEGSKKDRRGRIKKRSTKPIGAFSAAPPAIGPENAQKEMGWGTRG